MARIFITGSTDGLGRAAARSLLMTAMRSHFMRDRPSAPRRLLTSHRKPPASQSVTCAAQPRSAA